MIPIRLELEAFLPFRTHQVLDFSTLTQAGMFLVCGNTGSGKTSIFDAICYALYGETSGGERDSGYLKSQFAEDSTTCFVEFFFESQGKPYRIRRTPKQLKLRRGGHFSEEGATAELHLPNGKVLTKVNEVNQRILEIIGLNAEQFKKIVMLPQGEFRRFLSDSSKDKQEILRKLFGTEACEQLADALREKDTALREELSRLHDKRLHCMKQIEPADCEELAQELQTENPNPEQVSTLAEQLQQALQTQLATKRQLLQTTQAALHRIDLTAAEQFNQKLQRYTDAVQRLTLLQQQAPQKQQERVLVHTLSHVREVLRAADAVRQTTAELEQTRQQADTWKRQLPEAEQQLQAAKQTELLAQQEQAQLPALAEQLHHLLELRSLFAEQHELQQTLLQTERQHALLKQALHRFCLTEQRQTLLTQETLLLQWQEVQEKVRRKQQQTADLLSAWQSLQTLFFQDQAAGLAQELQQGLPCPVCGSTTHPCPAQPAAEPITRTQLDESASAYEHARTKLNQLQLESQRFQSSLPFDCHDPAAALQEIAVTLQELQAQLQHLPETTAFRTFGQAEFDRESGRLTGEAERLQQQFSHLSNRLANVGEEATVEASIQQLQQEQLRRNTKLQESTRQLQQALTAHQKLQTALEESAKFIEERDRTRTQQQQLYTELLEEYDLQEQQLSALAKQLPRLPAMQSALAAYEQDLTAVQTLVEELAPDYQAAKPIDLDALQEQHRQLTAQCRTLQTQYEAALQTLDNNRRRLQELTDVSERHAALSAYYGQLHLLFMAASGRNTQHLSFERYVLARYFDQVIEQANLRLHQMTSGRYHLRRIANHEGGNASSGLDLEVFDAYCGKYRPVSSLSGGESFKTALCMALGLADSITAHTGGVEIGAIFIDEGFGSLDQSALDQAIDCLFSLQEHGRTIGIISHVDTLRERIPTKVLVSRDTLGSALQIQSDHTF